jgi:hypothetical protein
LLGSYCKFVQFLSLESREHRRRITLYYPDPSPLAPVVLLLYGNLSYFFDVGENVSDLLWGMTSPLFEPPFCRFFFSLAGEPFPRIAFSCRSIARISSAYIDYQWIRTWSCEAQKDKYRCAETFDQLFCFLPLLVETFFQDKMRIKTSAGTGGRNGILFLCLPSPQRLSFPPTCRFRATTTLVYHYLR